MHGKFILTALAVTALLFSSVQAGPQQSGAAAESGPMVTGQPPRVVMVKVGGQEVTVKDFIGYLQKNQTLAANAGTPTGKTRAVKAMVANMLIRQDIKDKGLVPKDKLDDEQAMLEGYRKLADQYFPLPPAAPESELRTFYEQHRIDYGIPKMRRISQIQVKIPIKGSDAQKQAAKHKAEEALHRLEAGVDFAKVAAELSDNRRAREFGGDLGFFPEYKVPEQLTGLKAGQHTGLIESPKDYQILKWTEEREEMISPFEDVKARVEQRVREVRQDEAKDVYLAGLTKKTPVVIVQEELKPLFPRGLFGEISAP